MSITYIIDGYNATCQIPELAKASLKDAREGLVYALGDCGDFEAAEEVAFDIDIQPVWIADADTARQWMRSIAARFEECA